MKMFSALAPAALSLALCSSMFAAPSRSLLASSHAPAAPSIVGFARTDIADDTGGYSIASGDLNGDGRLDLVTATYSHGAQVFPGDGDGTFQSPINNPVPGIAVAVGLADFNKDGKLDAAVVNQESSVGISIFLGKGDGTFQPRTDYSFGTHLNDVRSSDLNGDGVLDLATIDCFTDTVYVLLGNPDGSFQPAIATNLTGGIEGIDVGDFNSDGKVDAVVTAELQNSVLFLAGNGDGTFAAPTSFAVGKDPTCISAADLNHDGHLDVVACDLENNIRVLLGNGDGTFQSAVKYAAVFQPNSVRTADFNRDSILDVAVVDSANQVGVLLGNGDGTLQPVALFPTAEEPYEVATGDFNADGMLDMATMSNLGRALSVLLQTTAVLLPQRITYSHTAIGTNSAAQTATLTNTGSGPLNISGITFTGTNPTDFVQRNTCGNSLAAGASCSISISFQPKARGMRSATLNLADDAIGSPQTISLTGTGTVVLLQPRAVDFGTQKIGTTSNPTPVTLTNQGQLPLDKLSINGFVAGNSSDFSQTNDCPSKLDAGASCTIMMTFKPSVEGAESSQLQISYRLGNGFESVGVRGTGTP